MSTRQVSWYGFLIHGMTAALCVLVVLLARENHRLEDLLASLIQDNVEVGDHFPDIAVTGLDGGETTLSFEDAPNGSLVLVFSTTCPTCEENLDHWRELHERAGEHYRFAAIGIDEPATVRTYAEERSLPFDVFIPVSWRYFPKTYRIAVVPQTIVVGSDGVVKEVRTGMLPDDFLDRVPTALAFF